jgi:hypothetical protein
MSTICPLPPSRPPSRPPSCPPSLPRKTEPEPVSERDADIPKPSLSSSLSPSRPRPISCCARAQFPRRTRTLASKALLATDASVDTSKAGPWGQGRRARGEEGEEEGGRVGPMEAVSSRSREWRRRSALACWAVAHKCLARAYWTRRGHCGGQGGEEEEDKEKEAPVEETEVTRACLAASASVMAVWRSERSSFPGTSSDSAEGPVDRMAVGAAREGGGHDRHSMLVLKSRKMLPAKVRCPCRRQMEARRSQAGRS